MQERRDAGKEGCRKEGIRDAGKERGRKGGMQERRDEGCRKGGIQKARDAQFSSKMAGTWGEIASLPLCYLNLSSPPF